jgi:beta-galactosidase beta subunit
MKFEIDKETIDENKDFMRGHRDYVPLHIVRARVESIEWIDDVYRWVRFDIDEKGDYIEGTVEVLDRECNI